MPRPGWRGTAFGGLLPLRCPRAPAGWSVSPVLSPRALESTLGSCGAALERAVPCGRGQPGLCQALRPHAHRPSPGAPPGQQNCLPPGPTCLPLTKWGRPWGLKHGPQSPAGGLLFLGPSPRPGLVSASGWAPFPAAACGFRAFLGGQPHTGRLGLVPLTAEPRAGHALRGAPPRALETRPLLSDARDGRLGSCGLSPVRGPDTPLWSPGLVRSQMGVGSSSQAPRAPRLPLTLCVFFFRSALSPKLEFINLNIISGPGSQPRSP